MPFWIFKSEKLLTRNGMLNVFELHIYEPPRFVLLSIIDLHSEKNLNEMFVFQHKSNTRKSDLNLLIEIKPNKKFHKNSIRYRGAKLYNFLRLRGTLDDMENKNLFYCLSKTHHSLRERFILISMELVRKIFE